MLHRGPVVITSLEEDFKKIGLISENQSETVEESDGAEGADGSEAEGEEMDEARILKRLGKGMRRLVRTKRTPPSQKAKSRRAYRAKKAKIKMARRKAMRNPKKRRRAKWAAAMRAKRQKEGTENPIANLIEEVQDIVSSLDTAKNTDAIKSFANIAIIADMLSNQFNEWSENLDESYSDQDTYDTLAEYAESLADLAEAAAEVASSLKEGLTIESEETSLEDLFKEYMADMLEGMEVYNAAIAEMDTMHGKAGNVGQPNALKKKIKAEASDEDDEEDDEEEDDEDEDEEDDDAEDDEAEESKRPSKR